MPNRNTERHFVGVGPFRVPRREFRCVCARRVPGVGRLLLALARRRGSAPANYANAFIAPQQRRRLGPCLPVVAQIRPFSYSGCAVRALFFPRLGGSASFLAAVARASPSSCSAQLIAQQSPSWKRVRRTWVGGRETREPDNLRGRRAKRERASDLHRNDVDAQQRLAPSFEYHSPRNGPSTSARDGLFWSSRLGAVSRSVTHQPAP